MSIPSTPYLLFFPYLPLIRACTLGPWQIGPLNTYSGSWLGPEFRTMSMAFLASFRTSDGSALDNVCLLNHKKRGVDGKLPTAPKRLAIQHAVEFAVLDQNPQPERDNAGLGTTTADNAELFIWPIDVAGGRVTLERGSLVRTVIGGHRINNSFIVPSPLELCMPYGPISIDADLVAALYKIFMARLTGTDNELRRRIQVAIGWLSKSWRNTPSILPEDRIVYLKTGFEGFAGTSNQWECAKLLRVLYESQLARASEKDTQEILWSPKEKARFRSRYKKVDYDMTDLQHWFMKFSDVRNCIIHEGITPNLHYRANGSRYNGHFMWTAERLIRESIKVSIGSLGYPDMWRSALWRAIYRTIS